MLEVAITPKIAPPADYSSSIKMLQLPYNLLRDFCALVNERYVGAC